MFQFIIMWKILNEILKTITALSAWLRSISYRNCPRALNALSLFIGVHLWLMNQRLGFSRNNHNYFDFPI